MTLRELINRLEVLSKNGRNDNMSVEFHDEMYDMDLVVKDAYIEQFNNGDTFDESDDSYEYIGFVMG